MRCYLIAEPLADPSAVRAALNDLGLEVVEPAHAFDSSLHSGRGWLPDVDFVCVLFAAEHGWETPVSVFLEIGQAVGAAIPVLVIAEPPRRLDAALSLLRVVRVPARSSTVLAAHIQLFMKSIGRPLAAGSPPRSTDAAELRSVRDELAAIRASTAVGGSGGAMHATSYRVEQLALRLLSAAGAEAQETTGADGIGDFAVWVPGTENFIPGPLLVELRVLRSPVIERSKLDQLQLYALSRDAQWSLLLYYRWDRNQRVQLPKGGTWPLVMVFDIEELAKELLHRSLAEVLNNERNAIIHGMGNR